MISRLRCVPRSAIFAFFGCIYLLGLPIIYFDRRQFIAPPTGPTELSGLPVGIPFGLTNQTTNPTEPVQGLARAENITTVLRQRIGTIFDGAEQIPLCMPALNLERYRKTALEPFSRASRWSRGKSAAVYFAIDLVQCEHIMPALSIALITALSLLKQNNRIYVSIYENGSTDRTKSLLSELASALDAVGLDGLWIHASPMQVDRDKVDRINMLSEVRNEAIAPLLPFIRGSTVANTLVFMNDIVTCPADILELVHQQRLQQADLVAAGDWAPHEHGPRPYDLWVLRGIDGGFGIEFETDDSCSPMCPGQDCPRDVFALQDQAIYARWLDGLPVPIYSGWGGMAAFDASLFAQMGLRFRSTVLAGWERSSTTAGPWGDLLGQSGYLDSDCPGDSECNLIARDIWNLRKGHARVMLAPLARAVYEVSLWKDVQARVPPHRTTTASRTALEKIDWSKVVVPTGVLCAASRHEDGSARFVWTAPRPFLDPMNNSNSTSALR